MKAIAANKGFGMAALTSLTVQNSTMISGLYMIPPSFVSAQISALLSDIQVDAIKIGMLGETPVIDAVSEALEGIDCPIVLDPVMTSAVGNRLLAREAVSTLRELLLPRAAVLTPNLLEASVFLQCEAATDRQEMERQGHALLEFGAKAVLLKGGRLAGPESPDLLVTPQGMRWFEAIRCGTQRFRGTGGTLSSALATQLALMNDLEHAVHHAKLYTLQCIKTGTNLISGRGARALDHLWQLR